MTRDLQDQRRKEISPVQNRKGARRIFPPSQPAGQPCGFRTGKAGYSIRGQKTRETHKQSAIMSVEEGGGDLDDSWSLGSRSSSSIAGSAANDEKQGANGPPSADSNNDAMIYEKEKTARILAACREGSIEDLQELAMSKGGFLSDANRALACELVGTTLGTQHITYEDAPPFLSQE